MQFSTSIKHVFLWFAFLGILFIPVDYALFPFQNKIGLFFGASSDTKALVYFILVLFLLAIGLVFSIPAKQRNKIEQVLFSLIYWYLSLQLMRYGANKLFKHQFYLPEPNILFTRVGKLDRDILYWTSMGTSYEYSVFMGVVEILPAIFLLIPRFRFVGLMLSVGVFTNVLAVNIGFDITVKCFSSFLLFLSVVGMFPYRQKINLLMGFSTQQEITVNQQQPKKSSSFFKRFIRLFGILFIFAETLYPYVQSGNFNDDKAPRPYLHGAYKRVEPTTAPQDIAFVFIHRRGYLIFQNASETQSDYQLKIVPSKHLFMLTDYKQNKKIVPYTYDSKRNRLKLKIGGGIEVERVN
jgi:hypothetical protein